MKNIIPPFRKEQEEYFLEHERLVDMIDEDEKIGGIQEMEYKWEDDQEAWDYLRQRGFQHHEGVILSPQRRVTRKEDSAIIYLHTEWDWGYEGDFM